MKASLQFSNLKDGSRESVKDNISNELGTVSEDLILEDTYFDTDLRNYFLVLNRMSQVSELIGEFSDCTFYDRLSITLKRKGIARDIEKIREFNKFLREDFNDFSVERTALDENKLKFTMRRHSRIN